MSGVFGVVSLQKRLKKAFGKIKEEFDEHLDTINQNTNEIQANYEFLCELDAKIDKLNQRLDDMQMLVSDKEEYKLEEPVGTLTKREQEVFMVLYTNENENLHYKDIARKLGLKEEMVRNYVSSLSSKGIPILKKFISDKAYVMIEPEFRNLQAKENVLNINETLARQFV